MEIGFLMFVVALPVVHVLMGTFLFVVYKTTGGKWNFFHYMRWFINHC